MVRIVGVGDNDVDCYLSDGLMYPGGNCFNVSVFARRCGAAAAYVGAVGDDAPGRLIRHVLDTEGVDASHLRVVEGRTAHCVIGHVGGDRQFVSYDLGVSRFEPSRGDLDFIARHDAAHVYQHAGLDGCLGAISLATRLSYDFSTRREPDHRARVAAHCWLASISATESSTAELRGVVGAMHAAGARWVLATRGADGAVLSGNDGWHEITAAPATVVDTLGAGDSFIARVLVGLLRDESPDAVLQAAADEAARTCGYCGAVGYGVPSTVQTGAA
ncbi:PfkB family carbohydrate kinase [uncultured Alsobacter sp.]|uniref:PfkB family carbohydrate kinase n=1 Tax=uncultured Alsobacter sp. TaxID=1748258 RepID=UPI0025E2796B|nr:PfkB family carbohydrate kinase [uncultured Alsobacter sp.]